MLDTVQLFFFNNAREAEDAQGELAKCYVYFKAPFAFLRALRPIPPNLAALRAITRIEGNVDILWQYPRQHPKASDRTLVRCLPKTT